MAYGINIEQKSAIFRACELNTFYQVGLEFKLDKHYSEKGMRAKVANIYYQVRNTPEKYGISDEDLLRITTVVSDRKIDAGSTTPSKVETDLLNEPQETDKLVVLKDGIAELIRKKITVLGRSKKALDKESLANLTKAYSTIFDKSQLVQGKATEHISVMAKNVDELMSPEERMNMILKIHEVNQAKFDRN